MANTQIKPGPCPYRAGGFTLIELMVVTALVAILMAIAVPSYKRSIAKSDRSIAISDINKIAQTLERYYATQSPRAYTNDFGKLNLGADGATTLSSTNSDYDYTITLAAINSIANQAYTITATPDNSADTWTLRLNQIGQKTKKNDGDSDFSSGWPN